jgi:hypothetical protein
MIIPSRKTLAALLAAFAQGGGGWGNRATLG